MQCQLEGGIPNFASLGIQRIPDDGVIELTCNQGHHTFLLIQQAKFEILSELAVTALYDGYYRDAISSFASALERLFEFYIDIVCRTDGISRKDFVKAWKPLRKLSERQIGALALVYLVENQTPFDFLPDKHIAFRNDVIYNGKFPDRAESIMFGQAVADCALPLLVALHSDRYSEARHQSMFEGLTRNRKELGKSVLGSAHFQ